MDASAAGSRSNTDGVRRGSATLSCAKNAEAQVSATRWVVSGARFAGRTPGVNAADSEKSEKTKTRII
eukprot:2256167-Prymnesium_polylepis.1